MTAHQSSITVCTSALLFAELIRQTGSVQISHRCLRANNCLLISPDVLPFPEVTRRIFYQVNKEEEFRGLFSRVLKFNDIFMFGHETFCVWNKT